MDEGQLGLSLGFPNVDPGVGACCHFSMAGNPLEHLLDKAGNDSVLLGTGGNNGGGGSLLSVHYGPACYSL